VSRSSPGLRHFVALGLLGTGVVAGYHLVARAGAVGPDDEPGGSDFFGVDAALAAFGGSYDFGALRNLQRTAEFVRVQYVDPKRIDAVAMYEGALSAAERAVPEALLRFDADQRRLHVSIGGFTDALAVRPLNSPSDVVEELRRVAEILDAHIQDATIVRAEVEYAMINGMLSTLDPHSVFLPPESSKKMQEDNEGHFGGLGIQIKVDRRTRALMIDVLLEDTPAYRAGLEPNDRIVKIEGEGTLNMDLDEAVSKMRGRPGTPVTITIEREGLSSPRDFTIVRDQIRPNAVWGRLLEGDIAYLRIDQFHQSVDEQLDGEIVRLRQQAARGLRGVVLDLRDNPGGYLHQAVAVADRFMSGGVIVSTVGRDGRNRESSAATQDENDRLDVPIAVLTSGNSASAAEIVAGALKNTERAVIIGDRTFGKGSVQNLFPFSDTSRLKLTVARYLTPGDHSIQSVGIPPDIALERAYVLPPREVSIDQGGVESKVMSSAQISLFSRDRVEREADLEGRFDATDVADVGPPPTYTLRYLYQDDDKPRRTNRADVTRDMEVQFARDVLAGTRGTRRPEVLRDAAAVVQARAREEGLRIEKAFAQDGVGIDWSACANPERADVDVRMVLGEDEVLDAGQMETVRVEVTNRGAAPLCQVAVLAESGNTVIDDTEFYVGRIGPGETRGFDTRMRLHDGYPNETAGVTLRVQDANRKSLAQVDATVRARGAALPAYSWSWSMSDAAGGDGDGAVEVGETIDLNVDVLNVGEGAGGLARFLLKRDVSTGRAVSIVSGDLSFPLLAPGGRASGTLRFKVAEAPADGQLALELRAWEDERFDYGSVWRAGFVETRDQVDKIGLKLGERPAAGFREPPRISLSRIPDPVVTGPSVTLSGVVTDDRGLRDVIVYAGERKIAYEGTTGTPLTSIPFTATTDVDDGNTLLVVVARDADGLTRTVAVDVYRAPSTAAAGK
jgi:carboxyl-terminal processing protease